VGADSPPAAINPATAAAPDVVAYWRADPADLVTLTIVKLPEQDTEMRWQAAILHQALRDISAWPVSQTIHDAWRCRAIKVDAIADLHRYLVSGLERHWPPDARRESRIQRRANHTFGGLTEPWTDTLAAEPASPAIR
jgi:hypothetical protein